MEPSVWVLPQFRGSWIFNLSRIFRLKEARTTLPWLIALNKVVSYDQKKSTFRLTFLPLFQIHDTHSIVGKWRALRYHISLPLFAFSCTRRRHRRHPSDAALSAPPDSQHRVQDAEGKEGEEGRPGAEVLSGRRPSGEGGQANKRGKYYDVHRTARKMRGFESVCRVSPPCPSLCALDSR